MPRYGAGHEDFDAEAAALAKRRQAREALIAKEEQYQRSLAATSGLEDEAERKKVARQQARREATEVARREAAAADVVTRKVNVDTAAIERNTEARRRGAEVARRYAVSQVAGARPGFAVRDIKRDLEVARTLQREAAEKLAADMERVDRQRRPRQPRFAGPSVQRQAALYAEAMGLTGRQVVERSRIGVQVDDKPYKPPRLDAAQIDRDVSYMQQAREKARRDAAAAAERQSAEREAAEATRREAQARKQSEEATRREAQARAQVAPAAQRQAQAADQAADASRQDANSIFRKLDAKNKAVTEVHDAALRNQEAQAAQRKAEGQLKAAQTRLRKIVETPDYMVRSQGGEEALRQRAEKAQAAVERARVRVAEAQVNTERVRAEALQASERAAAATRAVREHRDETASQQESRAKQDNAAAARREAEERKRSTAATQRNNEDLYQAVREGRMSVRDARAERARRAGVTPANDIRLPPELADKAAMDEYQRQVKEHNRAMTRRLQATFSSGAVVTRRTDADYLYAVEGGTRAGATFHQTREAAQRASRARGGAEIVQVQEAARRETRARNESAAKTQRESTARDENAAAARREAQGRERSEAAANREAATRAANARQAEAVARENAEAARRETQRRERAVGTDIIRHPTLYGTGAGTVVDYSDAEKRAAYGPRGARPVTEPRLAYAPLTRERAAALELEQAEARLAAATRELTNVRRRKSATEDDRVTAMAERDDARRQRDAARAGLESARSESAARRENAEAARREADTRDRARRDIIRHPTLFGTGAGTTVDYTEGARRVAPRRRVPVGPGVLSEAGAGGQLGGGVPGYDERYEAAQRARAGRLANEAKAAGDAARASTLYTQALTAEERAQNALLSQRVDEGLIRNAGAADRQNRALRDSGVAFGTVSNAMHRHGALTTEFINAAARGETTLRELGNQSLATAGKFAGWTAAGAAIYTAVGAVRQLGEGAVVASDGVAQLQRVVPTAPRDESMRAFADLADEFNVPISEAADAVYRMGQRFHTLPEAVEAARASLYSLKTGEVDVATSTTNLLAIVSGFGLGASELVSVFDQINEAQNRFGVRIADTEAGLAKAAGAFRNSGGDLNYLLALFVAINRATARTGQEIGTGLARGVSQIRIPSHQEALLELGVAVDPDDLQATIQSAMEVARQPGADVNRIASNILGNQYARLLAPVLKDQTTLNQALSDTAPEVAKGSAQKELARVLSQVSEQAKAVGIGLQNIGAELARSGALIPFAGALKALNLMLDATGSLLGLFNSIPSPLRESVAVLGQMAVVMAGVRRFGGADNLAGGPLGFLANPDRRLQKYATKGLRDAVGESYAQLESQARQEHRRAAMAAAARQQVVDFERSPAFIAGRQLGVDDPERVRVQAHWAVLDEQAQMAERARLAAAQETELLKRGVVVQEQELARLQKMEAAAVRSHLAAQQTAIPGRLDAPHTEGVRYAPGVRPPYRPGAAPVTIRPPGAAPAGPTVPLLLSTGRSDVDRLLAAPAPRRFPAVDRAVTAARVRIANTAIAMEELGRSQRGLSLTGRTLERAAYRVVGGSAAAVTFVGRAAAGLRGAGGGLRRLARSLGPLDAALIGFFALSYLDSQIDKLSKTADQTEKFIDNYTGKTEQARAALERRATSIRAQRESPELRIPLMGIPDLDVGDELGRTWRQRIQDATESVNDLFNPVELFGDTLPGLIRGDYETPFQRRKRQQERLLRMQREQEGREAQQMRAASRGEPRSEMVASDLIADIRQTAADRNNGLLSLQRFDQQMAVYANEARVLLQPSKADTRAVRAALARATAGTRGPRFAEAVRGLDAKAVEAEIEALVLQMESFGAKGNDLRNLALLYARAVELHGGKTDVASLKALAQARDAAFQAVADSATREIDGLQSGGQADPRVLVNQLRSRRNAAQRRLNRRLAQLRRTQRDLERGPRVLPALPDPVTGIPNTLAFPRTSAASLRRRAARLVADIKRFRAQVSRFQNELNAAWAKLAEVRALQYEDRAEDRSIELGLRQSQTTDPVARARLAQQYAEREARDASRTFRGRGREARNRRRQAQTAANEARNEANEAARDAAEQRRQDAEQRREEARQRAEEARQEANERVRLLGELAVARAGNDPVAGARARLSAANAVLRSGGTQNERLQALIDIANANNELQDALTARENARLEVLASLTEDPVRQAQIKRRQAANELRDAAPGTERLEKRAAYNRAVQDYRNARVQDRRDDIDFELQMGKISTDTAANLIQALSRTKNLAKKTKRELLLEAKRLREEAAGDYELNIDALKLPSLYEIRRATMGGQQGMSITNQYRAEIHVADPQSALRVGDQMERWHQGMGRATARAVGVR